MLVGPLLFREGYEVTSSRRSLIASCRVRVQEKQSSRRFQWDFPVALATVTAFQTELVGCVWQARRFEFSGRKLAFRVHAGVGPTLPVESRVVVIPASIATTPPRRASPAAPKTRMPVVNCVTFRKS